MTRAIMGVSAAAVTALAPLCMPPTQAHADDPCVSITDPTAHQACIDKSQRDNPMHRYRLGDCEGASPFDGQRAKFVGNFWVRKSRCAMGGWPCEKDENRARPRARDRAFVGIFYFPVRVFD